MKRYIKSAISSFNNLSRADKIDVASSPYASSRDVATWLDDDDYAVRLAAAENPNAPAELLWQLSKVPSMREAVASNRSAPPELLDKLSKVRNNDVRLWVACNPSTPLATLKRLSRSSSSRVREAITTNPNAPYEILRKLAEDEDELGFIRHRAQAHVNYANHQIS